MTIQETITASVKKALHTIYDFQTEQVELQPTRKEFEGDITLVIFPYVKQLRKAPDAIANEIGDYLVKEVEEINSFNVVKGFLNFVISDHYFLNVFNSIKTNENYGRKEANQNEPAVMVEYSSPNTNKPLHLGHVRNNLLGYSVAEILKASGRNVLKTQIINDRGIHICKSMLAWQKFGEGETPESAGMKGDKLVGKYYVAFDAEYKKQIQTLISEGKEEELAKKEAPILIEAQEMLRQWEAGNEEVVSLWETMNSWVYAGFDVRTEGNN